MVVTGTIDNDKLSQFGSGYVSSDSPVQYEIEVDATIVVSPQGPKEVDGLDCDSLVS